MIAIILIFLILILFTIFLFNKPVGIIYLLISSLIFLHLIIDKLQPEFIFYVDTLINMLLLTGLLLYVVLHNKFSQFFTHPYLLLTVFICGYLIVLALLRGLPATTYFDYYRGVLIGSLIFLLVLIDPTKPNQKKFHRFLIIMALFQIFLGIVQYYGPTDFYQFLVERQKIQIGDKVSQFADPLLMTFGNLSTGTLGRYNHYGNFLALIISYFLASFFISRAPVKNKTIYWILIVFGFYAITLSGNKISLVSLFVGVLLILWFKNRRYFWIFTLVICVFLYFLLPFLANISDPDTSVLLSARNPFERMLSGFNVLEEFSSENQQEASKNIGTIYITFQCLPLIYDHFLFGSNLVAGNDLINIFSKLSTDATLAIVLAEFGIVGTFIVFSTFFYVLHTLKKNCSREEYYINIILFVVLLVQTLTDPGLISRLGNFIYFFISAMQVKAALIHKPLLGKVK